MKKVVLVLGVLALGGCEDADPRIELCKSAVTEEFDSRFAVEWTNVYSEPLSNKPIIRHFGQNETVVEPNGDTHYVGLDFAGRDAFQKRSTGFAICRFRPDLARGMAATSIVIDKRGLDSGEVERFNDRHLPPGAWKSYACKWYARSSADCR